MKSLVPAQREGPSGQVYLLAELVPGQRAGLPARQAGTRPAGRFTFLPSWYQASGQVYLLAQLAPAPQVGLPARQAGTSSADCTAYMRNMLVDYYDTNWEMTKNGRHFEVLCEMAELGPNGV
ncbi:hypothetical protein PCANC_11324 [Puccinia coronata f. sp. avenae]|uniref:Uncharacterized protein n=1 Tax=Puccinia coronata f. sp. avenae TaxID=200324 RepID=A0A2N5VT27_9BASI|nr:hypothetical protein PCANC_11324 [Puccinia coronata f. sp. avenae]